MRVTHHRTGQELAKRHLPGFGGNPNQFFASSTAIFPLGGVFRSVVLVLHSRKIYLLTQTHSHIHRALNTPWGLLHHLGPHEDSTELSRPPSTTTLPAGVLWFYATCFFLYIFQLIVHTIKTTAMPAVVMAAAAHNTLGNFSFGRWSTTFSQYSGH